jgi:hypothetical protein
VRQYGSPPTFEEAALMKRTKSCKAKCHIATVSRLDTRLADIAIKLRRAATSVARVVSINPTTSLVPVIKKKIARSVVKHEGPIITTLFGSNIKVRTVGPPQSPFYYAKDICDALGIKNPTMAASTMSPGDIVSRSQRATHHITTYRLYGKTMRVDNTILLLTEQGAYNLVMHSKGPVADQMRQFIVGLMREARLSTLG